MGSSAVSCPLGGGGGRIDEHRVPAWLMLAAGDVGGTAS